MKRALRESIRMVAGITKPRSCRSWRNPASKLFLARAFIPFLLLGLIPNDGKGQGSQQQEPNRRALAEMSPEQLAGIEVTTVSGRPEQRSQAPAAVYVITQQDIRRSGATSIPEALRLAPGVQVARANSNQWAIGIRGFASTLARSVLVLIDGRSVYSPLFAGTYWDVQDTLLDDIDRIEVIRGPGGTLWGANAVKGVKKLKTPGDVVICRPVRGCASLGQRKPRADALGYT